MRIHDVAKKLQVSVATISRALNPMTRDLVAPKTRRRIEKFVQRVGYVPNRTARELSTGKTRTIGVVLLNLDTRSHKRFNCVYTDHMEAARKGVTYLIQRGHKKIALIKGNPIFPEAVVRSDGYKKALAEHGLPINKELMVEGDFQIE